MPVDVRSQLGQVAWVPAADRRGEGLHLDGAIEGWMH